MQARAQALRFSVLCLLFLVLAGSGFAQAVYGLQDLIVAPEHRCSEYASGEYSYSQGLEEQVALDYGGLYSPYTGEWFASRSETDIEHIVARSEAHDSGLCAASPATRRRFAGDVLNITLASPAVNRHAKGDLDFGEWRPQLNVCWFANRIVQVKGKYNLTVDRREYNALAEVLSECRSTALQVVGLARQSLVEADVEAGAGLAQSASAPLAQSPSPASLTDAPSIPQPATPTSTFKNCSELRQVYPQGVRRGHSAYKARFDRDKDGHACE